jgi:hypothetical protein
VILHRKYTKRRLNGSVHGHAGGASWNQSGCPSRCHDSNKASWIGAGGPITPPSFQGEPMVAEPPNQAFFARDKPGTLRAVGGGASHVGRGVIQMPLRYLRILCVENHE